MKMKQLLIIITSIAIFTSCKKEENKVNPEDEARTKIENTNWVAYKGWKNSQQTNMVDLTPEQFIYTDAKISGSNVSLRSTAQNWKDFSTNFLQLTSTDEYQYSILNSNYQYFEFYVNKSVTEMRISIKESTSNSNSYMIFFKRD